MAVKTCRGDPVETRKCLLKRLARDRGEMSHGFRVTMGFSRIPWDISWGLMGNVWEIYEMNMDIMGYEWNMNGDSQVGKCLEDHPTVLVGD